MLYHYHAFSEDGLRVAGVGHSAIGDDWLCSTSGRTEIDVITVANRGADLAGEDDEMQMAEHGVTAGRVLQRLGSNTSGFGCNLPTRYTAIMPGAHRPQLLARVYACLIGMLIGQLFWFVLYDLARVGNIFAWFTYPIMILGWLLVWDDNGPPPWAESDRLHVVFRPCFYGAIGALVGLWAKRR